MLSERARLIEMISFITTCIKNQKLLIVENLLFLCKRNFEVMYRLDEKFVNETCLVYHCVLSKLRRSQSNHIHNCRQKEKVKNVKRALSFKMQYCYFCFQWVVDIIFWEKHCHEYLESLKSKWCKLQKYYHILINSDYCSFCLSNQNLSIFNILRSWTRNFFFMNHLMHHINVNDFLFITCSHSLCDTHTESINAVMRERCRITKWSGKRDFK
jgi:hypothetical protein